VRRGSLAKSITGYHKNVVRKQCPVLELANQMPVRNMDLARAPRRTAHKKGSGYENAANHNPLTLIIYFFKGYPLILENFKFKPYPLFSKVLQLRHSQQVGNLSTLTKNSGSFLLELPFSRRRAKLWHFGEYFSCLLSNMFVKQLIILLRKANGF
jgi:hypothetical protein